MTHFNDMQLNLLLQKFDLFNASYAFLSKHRASLRLENVLRMANSLSSIQMIIEDIYNMEKYAPDVVKLIPVLETHEELDFKPTVEQTIHSDDRNSSLLELSFPNDPQTSKRASEKRKIAYSKALQLYIKDINENVVTTTLDARNENDEAIASINKSKSREIEEQGNTHSSNQKNAWVHLLQKCDIYKDQIAYVTSRSQRVASYCDVKDLNLSPRIIHMLDNLNITKLYSHQFEAIQALMFGKNVILATSTASGKSLAYTVPMLQWIISTSDEKSKKLNATAFLLFPTKALAQDQLKSIRKYLEAAALPLNAVATFDGDTAMKSRTIVRKDSSIFLTNPDMLHLSILPRHTQWKAVFSKLKLIVVDEAHMYRGIFGSHLSCIFRRLLRICAFYGTYPQIIACSATIGNPEVHFNRMFPFQFPTNEQQSRPPEFSFFQQRQLQVITTDGAPSVPRTYCIWNSMKGQSTIEKSDSRKRKHIDDQDETIKSDTSQISQSTISQSGWLFSYLIKHSLHTILFAKGRKLAELLLMSVHNVLKSSAKTAKENIRMKKLKSKIAVYRGGYTASKRRELERKLFSGDLLGVISTNALEVGIDVGELDCTMHVGLPSSISSLWQQAGRAGRTGGSNGSKQRSSLALIVCFNSPLDQYFARHGEELFSLEAEAVGMNPWNSKILEQHVKLAARELPLFNSRSNMDYIDAILFGPLSGHDQSQEQTNLVNANTQFTDGSSNVIQKLIDNQVLVSQHTTAEKQNFLYGLALSGKFVHPISASDVNIRSISNEVYTVVLENNNETIDSIPGDRVFFQVYPTAVYLHQGEEYIIHHLDLTTFTAYATKCPKPLAYYTHCRDFTDVDVTRIQSTNFLQIPSVTSSVLRLCTGVARVATRVIGAVTREKKTTRFLRLTSFTLPLMEHTGEALWFEFPDIPYPQSEVQTTDADQTTKTSLQVWRPALHGLGHILLEVLRLFILCDANDVDTEHYTEQTERVRPFRVTLFETRSGGSGLINEIFAKLPLIINKAYTIVTECTCSSTNGCPSCVQSSQCTEYNHGLDKLGTTILLEYLNQSMENFTNYSCK